MIHVSYLTLTSNIIKHLKSYKQFLKILIGTDRDLIKLNYIKYLATID